MSVCCQSNPNVEVRNNYFKMDIGSDFTIFHAINIFKEREAIASIEYDKLMKYNSDPQCFNKCNAPSRQRRLQVIRLKDWYLSLPKQKRDFIIQQSYIQQMILIFGNNFEQLDQYYIDDDGKEIQHPSKIISHINSNVFKAYKIKYYKKTKIYDQCFDDTGDENKCNALVEEILYSETWIKTMKRNDVNGKCVDVSENENDFTTKHGIVLERSMIAFKMNKSNKWYPGVVIMFGDPILFIITPYKSGKENDLYCNVHKKDIQIKFLE